MESVTEMQVLQVAYDSFATDTNEIAKSLGITQAKARAICESLEGKGVLCGDMVETAYGLADYDGGAGRGERGRYSNRVWQSWQTYDNYTWEQVQEWAKEQGVTS